MPEPNKSAAADADCVELNLGPCHYGDFGEAATAIAKARVGIGRMIPVCGSTVN
jgi:hypothetical protein